ncbi:hypothetical protein PCS_00038 [Desulfocurvibacter africanus PCS]|uniref:Uncharacterized protein n=1 Tax=Desulfocurvibacter africanus PCS TaxID=1262666 RepID=M5PXX2_DESAF|nr:hypothetical protein [Desulfocurvibacter africanus]EMG39152.1 hypothetical protein PCS_00038 [Desulfocurvibacter africanus PCS]
MVMIRIPLFSGVVPRTADRLLRTEQATTAVNCRLTSGELAPLPVPARILALAGRRAPGSIMLLAGKRWLSWPRRVDAAPAATPGDETGRTCITGLDAPRVTDLSMAGRDGAAPTSRLLGVTAPRRAPVLAPGPGGEGDPMAVAYCYTFVTDRGEEGPPSPPSAVTSMLPGQEMAVYGLESPPQGRGIAQKRLYRTATPSDGLSLWLFVAEIEAGISFYLDAKLDVDLGESLSSQDWSPPTAGLRGVVAMPNGFLAGHVGNQICFSEPWRPFAWPQGYRLTLDSAVTGLGVFGTTLVAATADYPVLISGAHPAAVSMSRLPDAQPCVSAAAMASSELGVLYPCPDGLYLVGSGGGRLVTRELMTREEWQALRPETMCAAVHDGRYVAFFREPEADPWNWDDVGSAPLGGVLAGACVHRHVLHGSRLEEMDVPYNAPTGKGFVLDLSGQETVLSFLDWHASALHREPSRDALYLAGADEEGWNVFDMAGDAGGTALDMTWRSKVFVAGAPMSLAAVRIDADFAAGGLAVTIWADGRERLSKILSDSRPLRLPAGFRAREWQVLVSGKATVREIRLASSMEELNG